MTFIKVQHKRMSKISEATSRNINLVQKRTGTYIVNKRKNTENTTTKLDLKVVNVLQGSKT